MRILLAADHAGYAMKELLEEWLVGLGHQVTDMGTEDPQPEDDYPDFVLPLAREVAEDPLAHGIICAGSGEGEAMAANRIVGARATAYYAHNLDIVKLSREHNAANIFSIGSRFVSVDEAKDRYREDLYRYYR